MVKYCEIAQDIKDSIADEYVNNKKSIMKISKEYGYSNDMVKKILINENVHIRDLSESHALEFDKTYFEKIDTPNKAYWLGFIYADGSLSSNGLFSIKQGIKDINVLENFKKDINSEHKITISTSNNGYNKGLQYCVFNIRYKKLYKQLQNLGVNSNKTFDCKFPDENILPKEYKWDFIRGFFDGDGSAYVSHIKWKYGEYEYPSLSFTGTQNMLENILQEVQKHYNTNAVVRPYYNDKPVYDLKFGGIELVNCIYHLMYDNAERYTKRKRDIFEQFKNENGVLETRKFHNAS